MKTIQQLLGMGVMAMSQSYERLHNRVRKLRHEDLPKCAACQFGKQTSRRVPGRKSRMIKEKVGVLSAEALYPGERVFVDHFVCSTRGRKIEGQGIRNRGRKASVSEKAKSYSGGCIFVDAATGYIQVEFQSFFSAEETVKAVQRFETHAADRGIRVKEYHLDNGTAFTAQKF